MSGPVIVNAVIDGAQLTIADHGLLSAWLRLNYGFSAQGFGGHSLYLPKSFQHHPGQANYAGHFIFRCLQIAGVEEWAQLCGKTIRVKKQSEWGAIIAVGHIVNDDWFDPAVEFAELKAGAVPA